MTTIFFAILTDILWQEVWVFKQWSPSRIPLSLIHPWHYSTPCMAMSCHFRYSKLWHQCMKDSYHSTYNGSFSYNESGVVRSCCPYSRLIQTSSHGMSSSRTRQDSSREQNDHWRHEKNGESHGKHDRHGASQRGARETHSKVDDRGRGRKYHPYNS